jgi:hypothetical protein
MSTGEVSADLVGLGCHRPHIGRDLRLQRRSIALHHALSIARLIRLLNN